MDMGKISPQKTKFLLLNVIKLSFGSAELKHFPGCYTPGLQVLEKGMEWKGISSPELTKLGPPWSSKNVILTFIVLITILAYLEKRNFGIRKTQ